MSNLTINPQWHDAINQVETDEFITGGADGNANLATRQLAENIFWLKNYVMGLPTTTTPNTGGTTTPPTTATEPTNGTDTDTSWQKMKWDNLRITALPPKSGLSFLTEFKFETLPAVTGTLGFEFRLQNMTVVNYDDPNFKHYPNNQETAGLQTVTVNIVDGVGVFSFLNIIANPTTVECPYLYIIGWQSYSERLRFPAALFDITKSADAAFLGYGETNNTGTQTSSGWMIESA